MVIMYYVLSSDFKKVYVEKKLVGKLKKLGYRVFSERRF